MRHLFVVAFCLITWTSAQNGPCFEFDGGNAFLEFEPDNFNISESAHYQMTFKTTQENGILLYAHGSHDFEVLYIRNGILNYDLINPESSGVGRSFGVHLESDTKVNNNTFITVELFRNRRVRRGHARMLGDRVPIRTGLKLKTLGRNWEEVHFMRHVTLRGVQIQPRVFIGGSSRQLVSHKAWGNSSVVRQFKGQISDIREKRNRRTFMDPSRNSGVHRCLVGRRPN